MKTWAHETFGNVFKKKRNLLARIKGIQKVIDDDSHKVHLLDLEDNLRKKLDQILDQEEEFWNLRARSNWIMEGDKNTKFFHTSTIIRRKRNKIEFIKTDCGREL